MTDVHMLTTVDNPYDPFTNFDEWNAYDMRAGYHTMAFLARIVVTSPDLSDADQDLAIELAVQEIAKENVSGVHRMIKAGDHQRLRQGEESSSSID